MNHGWVVASDTGLVFRTMRQGQIVWTGDPEEALQFYRRQDAEKFSEEDEDAWQILPIGQAY